MWRRFDHRFRGPSRDNDRSRRRPSTAAAATDRLLAMGERTLRDQLAPTHISERTTHVTVDDELVQVLSLSDYPRSVSPGWLEELLDLGAPLDLSLHLTPLDSGAAIRRLTHRLVELQSSRLLDARGGRIHRAEREVAYEDSDRLRDALQRGEERVFSTALSLLLRAPTLSGLEDLGRRVERAAGGLLAAVRPATLEHLAGLRGCLPTVRDELGRRRTLDTTSVATMLPFAAPHYSMEQGLLAGVGRHGHGLVMLDPFSRDLDNANTVVFATSGAGKSYACKVMALRALLRGISYSVIDPEHEYRRLAEAVGGRFVPLSGGAPHHLNPFDLPPPSPPPSGRPVPSASLSGASLPDHDDQDDGAGDDHDPDPADGGVRDVLAEQIRTLHGLLGLMLAEPGGVLTLGEQGALDAALYETYRRAGITPDPRTHHRLAPVLGDLHTVLREHDSPYHLADRLTRYVSGSLGRLFASPTSVRFDRGLVVFGVRDLEAELRPLGMYLIADYLWRQVRRAPTRRIVLIDEAWQLVQHPEGARFLGAMARQARKHALGLTTITQDVADFLATPEGHTVLANAATRLLLRQDASTIEAVSETFRLSAGERGFLLGAGRGEGLLMSGRGRVALAVVASPAEHALATTDPAELAALERRGSPPAGAHRTGEETGGGPRASGGDQSGALGTNGTAAPAAATPPRPALEEDD